MKKTIVILNMSVFHPGDEKAFSDFFGKRDVLIVFGKIKKSIEIIEVK